MCLRPEALKHTQTALLSLVHSLPAQQWFPDHKVEVQTDLETDRQSEEQTV